MIGSSAVMGVIDFGMFISGVSRHYDEGESRMY
jgi:hypothetical protein